VRRVVLLTAISIIFAGVALALLDRPSLNSKVMATQRGQRLKLTAEPPSSYRFTTLESLVGRSPEIVVGVPIAKSSYRRSPEDRMVFTDYEVQVLENLKGDRHPDRKLTLRVPGGFMSLPDNKTVEVSMPDFWKNPEIGKGYIFFLTRTKGTPSMLVGGPQGAFEISPWPKTNSLATMPSMSREQVVIPQVRETDELTSNYKGANAAALIDQIKGMIGK
jgi:hypothetical protein